MQSSSSRLSTTFASTFAFLASITLRGAHACRVIAGAALRWPAVRATTRWDARGTGMAPTASANEAEWALATPVMVVISRLLHLALALCIFGGELSVNAARVPAVLHLPGGEAAGASSGLMTALMFVATTALYGALALELYHVVPVNACLFPTLATGVRRVFRILAVAGFALSLLTMGLLYGAGAALLEGTDLPGVSVVISLLQGPLLALISVPALWALLLGLLAVLAVVCAALWLVLLGPGLLCLRLAGEGPISEAAAFDGREGFGRYATVVDSDLDAVYADLDAPGPRPWP